VGNVAGNVKSFTRIYAEKNEKGGKEK